MDGSRAFVKGGGNRFPAGSVTVTVRLTKPFPRGKEQIAGQVNFSQITLSS
jgi:hypothetical protein